ncbi:MAG: hypothetical protein ABSB39_12785 [Candidatus Sulfotelmatobacter sp.]|jgi:hypothetical protein
MDISMPREFPEAEFRAFGRAADAFFPGLVSDENLSDPLERRTQFDWAWQAVRYRYRLCAECSEEFRSLLANASESWRADAGDEGLSYKLERCIYIFFMSGLSVFESLGFCLYFLGNALEPSEFPHVAKPKKITLDATNKAFGTAFPRAAITRRLAELTQKPEFTMLDGVRNTLAHRLSGRRSVRSSGILRRDRTYECTRREDEWYIPGSNEKLMFDEGMLQRQLTTVTSLLSTLVAASREFAEQNQAVRSKPAPGSAVSGIPA